MRLPVQNIWVDAVTFDGAIEAVKGYLDQEEGVHVVFASNPEKNFSVPRDPELFEFYKNADLLIPDGIGMVYAARVLHRAHIERVPGCELMERLCDESQREGYRVFLYGAQPDVMSIAEQNLRQKYPDMNVVGSSHGFVAEEEMPDLVSRINQSGADILFIGLGSPRQEKWLSQHGPQLSTVRVCQGVGGTFNVLAGTVKRAPAAFRKLGLEWLYRLLSDPRRIGRQLVLPVFAFQVFKEKMFGR